MPQAMWRNETRQLERRPPCSRTRLQQRRAAPAWRQASTTPGPPGRQGQRRRLRHGPDRQAGHVRYIDKHRHTNPTRARETAVTLRARRHASTARPARLRARPATGPGFVTCRRRRIAWDVDDDTGHASPQCRIPCSKLLQSLNICAQLEINESSPPAQGGSRMNDTALHPVSPVPARMEAGLLASGRTHSPTWHESRRRLATPVQTVTAPVMHSLMSPAGGQ